MKYLGFFLLIFSLHGCTTDVILPCEGDEGPVGSVCRSYRYVNDSPVGYVEHEYEADSVTIEKYYNQQSELKKTITERFQDGKTSTISEQFPDVSSQVQSWHYNAFDSLESKVFGANDSSIQISYEGSKRSEQRFFHDGELNRYLVYRYYQDDGELYRISMYDGNDSLVRYWNFDYFSSGHKRVSYYRSNHSFIGRSVFSFSQLGLITSREFTNPEGQITSGENYIYDVAGKLIEESSFNLDQTTKTIYLYY